MSIMESRRDFIKKSSMLIGGTAVLGSAAMLTGCAQQAVESQVTSEGNTEVQIPAHPYQYAELDVASVQKVAFDGYFEGGCCYGAAKGLLTALSEKVGFPFTAIPPEMFRNGGGGYGAGTLCGALGGAVAVIGLVCSPDDSKKITAELFKWYTSTNIPMYPSNEELPSTVSPSVNCVDSVTTFLKEANAENGSDTQRNRCGALTADVAGKTVELLNVHFGFASAPAVEEKPNLEETLKENEYIGEAEGFGGPVKVKVTMDGDKIANIEVLSHGETAGVSDPAFKTVPDAIIAAQSTEVDAAAGATVSSKAIMAAVEDALSKVK